MPLLLTAALWSTHAQSETRTFTHRAANGTVTFSDAPLRNGKVVRSSYKNVTRKPTVANPCKGLTLADLDNKARQLHDLFTHAASQSGVDTNLLKAVARAESCFDPAAVSRVGAQGLMQLMPATARQMGVKNTFDAQQNLYGGARYLAAMLLRYSNNLDLALAAYNAGPSNVDRYGGVPPFRETQRYLVSVKRFRDRYRNQGSASPQLAEAEL